MNTSAAQPRYRLIRQLGAGGMAQVVEGVAVGGAGFERRVAIKWILPQLAGDESIRRMFLDEARIASHLHHANIVQVLDYGEMDGTEFIVFEYVDGIDLGRARRLSGGTIPVEIALHVVSEIADALAYAHGRRSPSGEALGIVHRDVSPANILVSWEGDVKLSDFGIALAEVREERTATGIFKGKASFMAPEQALGERATPLTDVFALGLTLERLLTGSATRRYGYPVEGEEPDANVDPGVAELIAHCTRERAEERPSAGEVARLANMLRSTRTTEAGRHAVQEWLASLDHRTPAPRSVDAFAGRYIVGGEEGSRRFELTQPSAPDVAVPTSATGATPAGDSETPSASSRRLPILVGVLGVVAIASIVALQLDWGGHAAPADPTTESASEVVEVAPAVAPPREEPERAIPSIPEGDEPPAPSTEGRSMTMRGGRAMTRRASEPTPEPTEEVATEAVVQIGGARLVRGRIFIDGRARGQAPATVRTTAGHHTLRVLALDDDTVLYEESITLEAHHTALAPLRVIVR